MLKTKMIELDDRGRILHIEITEMPARKLEAWAVRAVLALQLNGEGLGIDKLANSLGTSLTIDQLVSMLMRLDWEKAEPLFNEMVECCKNVVDGNKITLTPQVVDATIEDVRTLARLQFEAIKHNFSFFMDAVPSNSTEKVSIGKPKLG